MTFLSNEGEVARNRPSLFVIALPRSLSTWVFERARTALGLSAPAWTSAGEILNTERWGMLEKEHAGDRFTTEREVVRFERWSCFLADVVWPRGHAYKDVVQPFVAAHWLAGEHGRAVQVLRVSRPLADIAWSMLKAGWRYPATAAVDGTDDTDRLLSGLLRARVALAKPRAAVVDFDALVQNPQTLIGALAQLYPEIEAAEAPSEDANFREYSQIVLERRCTPLWRDLDARIRRLAPAG